MKYKFFSLITTVILLDLFLSSSGSVFAQSNTFQCRLSADGTACEVFTKDCNSGYVAYCDEFTAINCPINQATNCRSTIPSCTSPYQCIKYNCPTGDIQINQTCSIADTVCCQSYQNCIQQCLATSGNTPAECTNLCNQQAGTGPKGPGGTGNPSQVLVNLNSLITGMGGKFATNPDFSTFGGIITVALPILYFIAGILLMIYLIASGFSYMMSAGDPKKMEAAKAKITAAVVGFILVISAFWLTQIAEYIFGLGTQLK